MNLIINTTVLNGTGVFQVALSFIEECRAFPENSYHVFLCRALTKQINKTDFPANFFFYDFEDSPVKIKKRCKVLNRLKSLEKSINPDCIFTVFGPAYWKTKKPHIVGFALGHSIYPASEFFKRISLKELLTWKFRKIVQKHYFKQHVLAYITETEDASNRLANYLQVKRNKVFTVSNTYNAYFINPIIDQEGLFLPKKSESEFRFLMLASYNRHKNFEILNELIPILHQKGIDNVKFILTLDNEHFQNIFQDTVKRDILNIGRIDIKDCPQLYSECDVLFSPTLLECFSANYPEAMKMQKPILTSQLSFAQDVCQEAALYCNPTDACDIAQKIEALISNKNLQVELIEKGNIQLQKFPTAKERAKSFLSICQSAIKQ